jgi:hypothetical protein
MTTPYCIKCNLVMKAIDKKISLAVIDTIYECPLCDYKIGIITLTSSNQTGSSRSDKE